MIIVICAFLYRTRKLSVQNGNLKSGDVGCGVSETEICTSKGNEGTCTDSGECCECDSYSGTDCVPKDCKLTACRQDRQIKCKDTQPYNDWSTQAKAIKENYTDRDCIVGGDITCYTRVSCEDNDFMYDSSTLALCPTI